jgi:hypothetical protein
MSSVKDNQNGRLRPGRLLSIRLETARSRGFTLMVFGRNESAVDHSEAQANFYLSSDIHRAFAVCKTDYHTVP